MYIVLGILIGFYIAAGLIAAFLHYCEDHQANAWTCFGAFLVGLPMFILFFILELRSK